MAAEDHNRRTSALPVVSLFSGSGGLDHGFSEAGFEPILALDNFDAAIETYRQNHCPDHPERAQNIDISQMGKGQIIKYLRKVGVQRAPVGVIGGPPCQAFSVSNVHKKDDDPRAKLPEKYAMILSDLNEAFNIDFFLFENVTGLASDYHEEQFKAFKDLFSEAGFRIFEDELDASDFGVPQVRERVFVVGFNKKKYPDLEFSFPQGNSDIQKTVGDAIRDLPEPKHFEYGLEPEDIPHHPNHWCMRPKSKKFKTGQLKPGSVKGRSFRVLAWDQPSWTVAYGHREVHVHPSGKRRLSIWEAMRLQGFPDGYQLYGTLSDQIKLVSDAVPPPVGKSLASAIKDELRVEPQREMSLGAVAAG